jgi:hypothetical protein
MYIKPKNINIPSSPDPKFYPSNVVLLDGGLNLVDKEYKISDSQTSNCRNVWFKDGELGKRYGQDYLLSSEAVETPHFASYKVPYMGNVIKHCGTKLYKQNPTTGALTAIYSGLSAVKGSFFKQNGILFYMQANLFIKWDGTTASVVVPYIPTVIINRTPTGGGNTNENYNRIGKSFKNSFNGNGSATAYALTDSGLDATTVTCTVGGVAKVEGTDFTVNRTTGIVTFTIAPASGTNNVIITAHKTDATAINSILNCSISTTFGGQNDNRTFVGGNGSGYYFWTGISSVGVDPTYWAYNNYNIIGLADENIIAFGKHYDTLCIHKSSGEIYGVTYSFNGTVGVFNSFPISDKMGCDCTDSIQTINSNSVWLSTRYGVCTMVGTTVGSQRNVFPISRNVNPRLLAESNLVNATSADYNGKYWLCINDKVYLWDYFISPYVDTGNPDESARRLSWWYFDNINAGNFIIVDPQTFFYVKRDTGKTIKFHTTYDPNQFYDFGNGISALYRFPARQMGDGIYEFTVDKGFIGVRGDLKTSFTVTYFSNDDFNGDPSTETIDVGSFMWNNFSWDNFTWSVMGPVYSAVLIPGAKGVTWFGAEFFNNQKGRDMNISAISFKYKITKLVK